MSETVQPRFPAPTPHPYHRVLASVLERREEKLWRWFSSEEAKEAACDEARLALLQKAQMIARDDAPQLYLAANQLAEALALPPETSLHIADALSPTIRRDAALFYEPDQAHIVFSGDLLAALTEAEIRYVLAHELAHHRLWLLEAGDCWTARRTLDWIVAQSDTPSSWRETARLERVHSEIYADRFGLWAVGDLDVALSAHVKIAAGRDDLSPAAYLSQAQEAIDENSHGHIPEGFIRAASLAAWAHEPKSAEAMARQILDGGGDLERLDVVGQERLSDLTLWMLYEFLTEPWASRDLIRAHARLLSPELADLLAQTRAESDDVDIDRLRAALSGANDSIKQYLAYLLLDFTTIDPQIEHAMQAAAITFARDFGLSEAYRAIAAKELKMTKSKLSEIEREAEKTLRLAEVTFGRLESA